MNNKNLYKQYKNGLRDSIISSSIGLRGAFITIPVIVILTTLLYVNLSVYFEKNSFFKYLYFIKITDESAKETIKNAIANSATLIGLTFVVIGFLFETAKDKTQQTFKELFNGIGLYRTLSYSLTVVAFHIILNALTLTLDKDIVSIMGIWSSYLMLFLVFEITRLFWQLVKIYSPNALDDFSTKSLIKAARKKLIQELFIKKGREIYLQEMTTLGLTQKEDFFAMVPAGHQAISFTNGNGVEIYDIRIKALRNVFSYYPNDASEIEFSPMYLGKPAQTGLIFAVPINDFFSEKKLSKIRNTIKISSHKIEKSNFVDERRNLTERLTRFIEAGDLANVQRQLEDIERLYELVYQQ